MSMNDLTLLHTQTCAICRARLITAEKLKNHGLSSPLIVSSDKDGHIDIRIGAVEIEESEKGDS
jgi:hypothetical protein